MVKERKNKVKNKIVIVSDVEGHYGNGEIGEIMSDMETVGFRGKVKRK